MDHENGGYHPQPMTYYPAPGEEYLEGALSRPTGMKDLYRKGLSVFLVVVLLLASWYLVGVLEDLEKVERTDWAYQATGLDAMNDRGFEGKGVIIGIVDTGIDANHDDLDRMDIIAWRDFLAGREKPYDDSGHGTLVAGIIGADGQLRGGAPEASFIICKALGRNKGTDQDVADAIDFCVDNGAHIISLSLGGDSTPFAVGSETERAVRAALREGVFVVCAAGNDGDEANDEDVEAPGNVPSALSIGSIGKGLRISPFSSRGNNDGYIANFPDPGDRDDPNKKPEFVAPGEKIRST